jgi:predicted transcriptional regulator
MDYPPTFTLRLDPDMRRILEHIAEDEDRSLSYIIMRYLRRGLVQDGYLESQNGISSSSSRDAKD